MRFVLVLSTLTVTVVAYTINRLGCRALRPVFATSTVSYDVESWRRGYTSCKSEVCEKLSGMIPEDLNGTYYRNGPAKFEVGKEKIIHPFDADGMITAIQVSNGSAFFRNRFVKTIGYKTELRTKRISYRGIFGTSKSGGVISNIFDVQMKNVANTNVLYWYGRLLALWEGGLPHLMEPDSLRTVGEYKFKGSLKGGDSCTAHPRYDAASGRLVVFSEKKDLIKSTTVVTVREYNKDLTVAKERTFDLPFFTFFHDFTVTKNHYIFDQAPLKLNPTEFVLGVKGAAECITFDSGSKANLILVPRDDSPISIVPVEPHFNFHFPNAFEDDNGDIVLDVVWCDRMELGTNRKGGKDRQPVWMDINYAEEVPYSSLMRFTLSPSAAAAEAGQAPGWRYSTRRLSKTQVDLPIVNPAVSCKKHRYVYACAGRDPVNSSPISGIVRLDTESGEEQRWFGQEHEFLGEPSFAPRAGAAVGAAEDDGYILSILTNGRDGISELVILDAQNISNGPVGRAVLPVFVPHGLHGSFAQNVLYEFPDVARRHKTCLALDNKSWNEMKGGFSGLGITID